jgi:hypothetical protein
MTSSLCDREERTAMGRDKKPTKVRTDVILGIKIREWSHVLRNKVTDRHWLVP